MKKLFLFVAIVLACSAIAQKKFDSVAYTTFNTNRWDKIDYSSMGKTTLAENLTTEEKIAGLGKAWAEAKYNFANFDLVPNLRWDSLYTAYISKVAATKTTIDYYRVLQTFFQQLRDGHTGIYLPFGYRKQFDGRMPLQVRWIEGRALVVANDCKRADEKSIKAGDELIAINGEPLQQYIQKNVSPYLHFSTPQDSTDRIYRYELFTAKNGDTWRLSFKTAAGKTVEQALRFEQRDFLTFPLPLLQFSVLPGNIGYLQVNSFNDEKVVHLFDSIFPSLSKTTALIIDVRQNGGGSGNNGFEMLACLTDKPFYTGKTLIRKYRPVGRSWGGIETGRIEEDDWKPYKKAQLYTKPVVVLTSAATYSAAEDFTATFKGMKRGTVIGEATGGSTGQPVFFTLPGGGVGAVCSKRDFFSNGTEFVGIGIQPDVVVHPTAKSIAAGKDDVLDAAIKELQK